MIYVVTPGDTVDTIADAYGISAASIVNDNQIPYPYPLAIGQSLYLSVPGTSASFSYSAESTGYAYPFIRQEVLSATLPFLDGLFIFSYGFTTEGHLIPPVPDDSFMISSAISAGVAPVLTLTPIDENGQFSNFLITQMINSPSAVETLYAELLVTLEAKEFSSVDVDFEYILPEDREAFAFFVAGLREYLFPYGYSVSVALAPKTSDGQKGLLYEGKDYALLGEAADRVLLMTYEWGYTYGPPMAVAPINKVLEVVEYAITRIPPEKIRLGIPNYGYDFTLPYEKGISKARTLGNAEATALAIAQGVPILFDEVAMSPYFNYEENGITHQVWFEDVRSYYEKFRLLPEYGLSGIGVWQLMRFFKAGWLLFQEVFEENNEGNSLL